METTRAIDSLLHPTTLATRDEALSRTTELPKAPGIYAWYFDQTPPAVTEDGVHRLNGRSLLYAGISPKKPRELDGKESSGTLRSRIRSHYRGNASQSTLRLTLGSLLHKKLGIRLQQTASGRFTFGEGEAALSAWMSENTRVCWAVHPEPWIVESAFMAAVPLRLNLDQNRNGDFHAYLTQARAEQRANARTRRTEI
jgi:hypothetical protein